jgi:LacI family transcriptional regulator
MPAAMNLTKFAEAIGLSISTVSRALNGYDDVNEETRRRVQEAAERLGYRPNAAGRRLRTGRVEAIGFVLAAPQRSFANFFQLELLAGIDEALRETAFHLIVMTARSAEDELSSLQRMIEMRQVDGVLLCRTRRKDERMLYLHRRGVPFAAVGRSDEVPPFPSLDIDHTLIGREACARLIALGHRKIGLVNTPAPLMFSARARRGYDDALAHAGLRQSPDLVVEGDITEEGGRDAARRLLALAAPPTALICGNDEMALGAMRAIEEAGLRAGHDVAVIGCDDSPLARYAEPKLTTFRAPFRAAGRRVTEMLMQSMDGIDVASLQEVWAPELVARASDGPPPSTVRRRTKSALAEDS